MRIDPNVVLADLTSVDKMLDAIKASEQAKTALTSELAEANSALEALKIDNEAATAKVAELEATIAELTSAVQAATELAEQRLAEIESAKAEVEQEAAGLEVAKIEAAVQEALAAQALEHEAAIADFSEKLATAEREKTELIEQIEATKVASEAVQSQLDTVAEVLEVKGVISETVNQTVDVNSSAAIAKRYEALANSIYPAQKAEARKIYAQHKAEIVAYLDSKTGTKSNPVADKQDSAISEEQWALYDSWRAERETLASKVSRLTEEQRTTLHVKNRRTYSANKELFDRCFAARSV